MAKLAGQGRLSLIGRAWERAEAARASSQAGGGHGQVLTLAGEPGVGKSELARAVAADAARDHGALVLWGDCYEGASQTPFGPWDAVFSPLGGLAVAGSAGLSSPDARVALFVSAHAALATARANGPVAVVVDDLQWAPPDSLALFEFLAARAATLGIVLVGTYRDPDLLLGGPGMRAVLASLARVPAATHVHLRGLDPEQVGAFMDARLGEGVPRAVASAVHAHTGGNPFYVREVANALVAEGLLVRESGRWLTHVSVPAIVIPPTVRHVVRARTDALSPGARAILNAASAFPEGFELDVVAAIARQDEASALDALEELLAAGFVRQAVPPALPYAFAHAIVRHAIDEGRSPDRSARLHRRAAEVLAGVRPGQYATAVEQWWRSRTVAGSEAGVPVGLAAADQAAASQAHGQAAHLLVLTLDLAPAAHPQRPEVLSCLALAAARALDADQATTAVAEVLPLLGPEAGAGLVVDVAEALREGAPPRTWEPLVTTALAGLTGGGGLSRARLLACLDPVSTVASGALRSGRWDGLPAEAVAALESSPLEEDKARALEPFRPRTEAETAGMLSRARGWASARARARALDFAGRDYLLRHGRPVVAVGVYREMMGLGELTGSTAAQAEASAQLAMALGLVGDFDEARAMVDRAQRLVGDLWPGHRLHLLGTVSSRVIIGYTCGEEDWGELAMGLRRWLGLPQAARAPWAVVFGALHGLVEAMDGNGEAAARQLRDVVGVLGELAPDDHSVGGTIHFAAAAAWKAGDAEAARRLAPLAERQARHGRSPGPSGSLAHTQARLAAVSGLPSTPELWQQARVDAEANGCRPLRLLVDYDEASAVGDHARILDLAPVMAAAGMAGWAALSAAGTPTGQRGGGAPPLLPSGLTSREAEVLGLVAGGSSSKEIAVELVLSVLTVNRHIANIYVKIGARNRAEATSFAHRHRLVTPRRD